MCDWLTFYPDQDAGTLHIDILMKRLLEVQPSSLEETDEMCEQLYPILDQIQAICIQNNLTQTCSVDMQDIDPYTINPVTMMRIIWNIYGHTKDHILLSGCHISNSNSIFGAMYSNMKGFLPNFVRKLIQID
jgi:hypothetical protein